MAFTECIVDQAALGWLKNLGYEILSEPLIGPDEFQAERNNYGQVVLERRLWRALQPLNPKVADAGRIERRVV